MTSYKRQDAFTSLRDLSRVPLMMTLPLQKLVLKSTSKMSLNDRFTQLAFSTAGWSEDQETRVEPRVEPRIEPRVSLRAVGVVICIMRGHSWKGRIRKIWGVHPMRVYSKDVFSCTNCGVKFGRTLSASWSPEASKCHGSGRTRIISSLSVIFTCEILWIMYMLDTS